jgi:hypothetical protein
MGQRHRNMFYLTGLPGWIRFGFSPGWLGRTPTGLPPTAQWLTQSGLLPQYMQYLQTTAPTPSSAPATPTYSKEQEKQMLEQQTKALEEQIGAINKRLKELSKPEKK